MQVDNWNMSLSKSREGGLAGEVAQWTRAVQARGPMLRPLSAYEKSQVWL